MHLRTRKQKQVDCDADACLYFMTFSSQMGFKNVIQNFRLWVEDVKFSLQYHHILSTSLNRKKFHMLMGR